ncbi:MAG: hypothetical protein AAF662_06050 [Pseudomonadota bacterium]
MPSGCDAFDIAIAEINPKSTAEIEIQRSGFDVKSFGDKGIHRTLANISDVNITRPNAICS